MSDAPKFSLLNHLKQKQGENNVKPTQPNQTASPPTPIGEKAIENKTQVIPRFKPAGGAGSTVTIAPHRPADSAVVVEKTSTPEKSGGGSTDGGEGTTIGVSTSLVPSSLPKGGLTHQLEAMKLRAEAGKKALDHLYLTEHKPFDELLVKLDSLFDEDLGLDDFNVQPARNIVEEIMRQLKEDPNLDGMMIDKDVGNILAFVRKVKGVALDAAVQKKAKAEKTAITKASKGIGRFDSEALEGLDFSVPVAKTKPKTLEDMANLDIDKLKF